jgi:hypothetical protein
MTIFCFPVGFTVIRDLKTSTQSITSNVPVMTNESMLKSLANSLSSNKSIDAAFYVPSRSRRWLGTLAKPANWEILRRTISRSILSNHRPELLYYVLLASGCRSDSKIPPVVDGRIPIAWVPINDHSSSFIQNTPSSSDIPSPTSTFPEHILLSGCDAAYRNGSGSGATKRVDETPARSLCPR